MTKDAITKIGCILLFLIIPRSSLFANITPFDKAVKTLQLMEEDNFTVELVIERMASEDTVGKETITENNYVGHQIGKIKFSGNSFIEHTQKLGYTEATTDVSTATFSFKNGKTMLYQPDKRLVITNHGASDHSPIVLLVAGGRRAVGGKFLSRGRSILPALLKSVRYPAMGYSKEKYENSNAVRVKYDLAGREEGEFLELVICPSMNHTIVKWVVHDKNGRIKMQYKGSEYTTIFGHSGTKYWIPTVSKCESYIYPKNSQAYIRCIKTKVAAINQPTEIPDEEFTIQLPGDTSIRDLVMDIHIPDLSQILLDDLDLGAPDNISFNEKPHNISTKESFEGTIIKSKANEELAAVTIPDAQTVNTIPDVCKKDPVITARKGFFIWPLFGASMLALVIATVAVFLKNRRHSLM